ncbi:MAG: CerR family C-terminal domain-containing protein [Gammaproteobacteria bacterium]|nr:CerR family C-terminal domain-containing protein [Gammaproteobacteria bacterium]
MNKPRIPNRGDQTRESLLRAALNVFGRDGFHAASTRAIADAAGVNQALIGYHFGGKEGLYLAVFEDIAERMSAQMAPAAETSIAELSTISPESPDRIDTCLRCIDMIFSGLLEMLGQNPDATGWVRLVMREQQDPTKAFEILYGGAYGKMLGALTAIVATATGLQAESQECRLKALMILSQVMFVMAARTTATRHMGWVTLGPTELEMIKQQALANVYAQFNGDVKP